MIWRIHEIFQEFHLFVHKCQRLTSWEFGNTTWTTATILTGLALIFSAFYLMLLFFSHSVLFDSLRPYVW